MFGVTCNSGLNLVSNALDVFAAQWNITSTPFVSSLHTLLLRKSPFTNSTFLEPSKSFLNSLEFAFARKFV